MFLTALLATNKGYGQEISSPQLEVTVGVAGTYQIGSWTEVRVSAADLAPGSYTARVSVLDADGNYAQFYSPPAEQTKSGPLEISVPVHVGHLNSDFQIDLLAASQIPDQSDPRSIPSQVTASITIPASDLEAITHQNYWAVSVGQVDGIEVTAEFVNDLVVTTVSSVEDLPRNTLCWEGFDTLYAGTKGHTSADWKAIKHYVHAGGHWVALCNFSAAELDNERVLSELPLEFTGTAQVRDLSRMESFTGEASRLRIPAVITIPRVTASEGVVRVSGLTSPFVVHSPWGLGQLTFVALDLNAKWFQEWEALPQLYRILGQYPELATDNKDRKSSQLAQAGLTDLKTQWDAALSDFGVSAPTIWLPLGLLLAVALLVGPLDYFIVRHVLHRPLLTWITFPLLILFGVIWGILGADSGTDNPSSMLANETIVVDYAADTNTQRVRSFTKVRAGNTGRFDLQTKLTGLPVGQSEGLMLTTASVPEATFRGYERPSNTHLDQTSYQIHPHTQSIQAAPILEKSTLLLEGSELAFSSNEDRPPLIESDLQQVGSTQIRGTLKHNLQAPLQDWYLACGNLVYFVNESHPQFIWSPDSPLTFPSRNIRQRELGAFFTGSTKTMVKRETGVGEDLLVQRQSYDMFSQNLDYILPIVTFHTGIGGEDYTRLNNRELSEWDMSEMLSLDRAILIGRYAEPNLEIQADDQTVKPTQRSTFLRMVIKVDQSRIIQDRLPEYEANQNSGN